MDYKNLPMFKTIDIVEGSNLDKFRKGELPVFNITKILTIGGIGYGAYLVATGFLSTLFVALGQLLAALVTGIAIVMVIMFLPLIFKGLRYLVRAAHKMFIRYDPFSEIYDGVARMYDNLNLIKNSILKIKNLEDSTGKKSQEYQVKVKEYGELIETSNMKLNKIKVKKEEIQSKLGKEAEHDDEFVKLYLTEAETLALTTNIIRHRQQAEDLIIKYGMRHDRMKKTRQKLEKVHSFTKIKISETETSVKILETDYQFAKEGAAATNAALAATKGLEGNWSVEYALEVATSSISADLHTMSMNLKEIDSIASGFDLDNDTMYDQLSKYTESIKIKSDYSADRYTKGNFTPTQHEKTISGLTDLF